jgi:hypothetical protein
MVQSFGQYYGSKDCTQDFGHVGIARVHSGGKSEISAELASEVFRDWNGGKQWCK